MAQALNFWWIVYFNGLDKAKKVFFSIWRFDVFVYEGHNSWHTRYIVYWGCHAEVKTFKAEGLPRLSKRFEHLSSYRSIPSYTRGLLYYQFSLACNAR